MSNLYADRDAFRRRYLNNAALKVADETEVMAILGTASREVDSFCNRGFFTLTAARKFDGNGQSKLWLPSGPVLVQDLLAVTSLKVDKTGDGVYETTLVADTDYWLWPDNETPKIRIDLNPTGALTAFPPGRRRVEIVGRWGYTEAVERLTPSATLAAAPAVSMTTSANVDLGIGQTLLIESEQVYISAGGASPWTVVRAVNGTTAAAHTTQPIDRFVYIPQVKEAALIQAGRLWKRRESAYSTIIQNPGIGTIEVYKGLDPDAKILLGPLRVPVTG